MAVTTGDSIYFTTGTQPESASGESSTQASSVQRAFDKRQRFNYIWADATERGGQVGMVGGSLGYEIDTKTDYIYTGSTWILKQGHAEFTVSSTTANTPGAGLVLNVAFTADTGNTTDPAMILTSGGNGILTFVNPGIYAVSGFLVFSAGAISSLAFLQLSTTNTDSGRITRGGLFPGDDTATLSMPNLRIISANQNMWFSIRQATGSTQAYTLRVRITRLG